MHPQESTIAAETRAAALHIEAARGLLAQPTPESLENCRTALGEAAAILEKMIVAGVAGWTPEFVSSLRQLQFSARALEAQVRHGSRFCVGWLHSRMGAGYSEDGTPLLAEAPEGATFEA